VSQRWNLFLGYGLGYQSTELKEELGTSNGQTKDLSLNELIMMVLNVLKLLILSKGIYKCFI
tara:strand:- start:304 stop:489 length:186 start_codon:yes stop_codon:yes gene_type:complete